MDIAFFLPLLFGLQAFYWFVGRRASKNVKTHEDYFLAGKSVRFFPLMMTFLATQVGGGVVLGAADEAFQYGWPVLLYPLGAALGLILLGSGVGRKLAGFPVSTVAEIFEIVYRSPRLRKIVSLLSVVSLFMILAAQIIASSKFLVSIGFTNTPLFIAFWAIVILYTVQGGLKAVISTDIAQASFFSFVFLVCFGFVAIAHPESGFQLPQLDHFASVTSKFTGWLLMPLMFMVIEQDMAQRCFAGSSAKIVSKASLLAGISTMVIGVIPVFFGVLGKSLELDVPKGASVLMATIAATTNPWVTALVGCAILAAIISTATSLINAISSNLSHDFAPKRENVRGIKGITAAIAIAAIVFAFFFDNVVDMLIQSYDLSVSCLFVPLIFALWKKQGNLLSALLSIVLGAAGFFCFRIVEVPFPKEIACVVLSLAGYACGELVSRHRSKEKAA